MYTDYYHLKSFPFENTPDPRFLFPSKKHREVLASLIYGVENSKGFIVLVGDIGTGKTTLIHALIKEMNPSYLIFNSINPELKVTEIIEYMTKKLGVTSENRGPFEVLEVFKEKLKLLNSKEIKVVLIIDEAHLLTESSLQKIRLLSNLESSSTKLIQIILVGQNELYSKLRKKSLKTLSQRVVINRYLEPLSKRDIKKYIEHRLRVAGRRSRIFSNKAISLISSGSRGFPRLINHICDNCLLIGYALSKPEIDHRIVKEVLDDMNFKKRKNLCNISNYNALFKVVAILLIISSIFFIYDRLIKKLDLEKENVKLEISADSENIMKEKLDGINERNNKISIKSGTESEAPKYDEKSILNAVVYDHETTGIDEIRKPDGLNGKKIMLGIKNDYQNLQLEKDDSDNRDDPITLKSGVMAKNPVLYQKSYRKDIHIGPFSNHSISEDYVGKIEYDKKREENLLKSDEESTIKNFNKEKNPVESSGKHNDVEDKKFSVKIVKKGENLSEISHDFYGVSMGVVIDLIQKANPHLYDINKIFPGQKLNLPHFEKKHLVVDDGNGKYLIHYSSYYNKEEAQRSCTRLKNSNESLSVITDKHIQGDNLVYRIYLGSFNSCDEAEKRLFALKPEHLSFILRKTGDDNWNKAE